MPTRSMFFLALLCGLSLPRAAFPEVKVAVSPKTGRVRVGEVLSLTATVTGTEPGQSTKVKWSVKGGATTGSIEADGNSATYTAPSDVPTQPEVTITATSEADPKKNASAKITVYDQVIKLSPRSVTLVTDSSVQFTATVTDAPGDDTHVSWSVEGKLNGTSKLGRINNGTYTAPHAVPDPATVTVTATSLADINKVASANVTVVPVGPVPAPVAAAPTTANPPPGPAKQGVPLNVDLTVQGNVTAQAVLIPQRVAKAIFGGKIASEYAVVQLIINNKSSDAALIVQGVYLDYRRWALAGLSDSDLGCKEEYSQDPKSKYANCTNPAQVASEEYRLVRGHALDAQTWTWRNGVVRGLVLAGTVATGLTFANPGLKYSQAVSAYNGDLVPGVSTFWPDKTVDQLNRISDVGYRTNKVIDKQGSDVIVGFFPIDRFLTPGFRQIFLKEPALFLSPYQLLIDTISRERIFSPRFPMHTSIDPKEFERVLGAKFDELKLALPCYFAYRLGLEDAESKAKARVAASDQDRAKMEKEQKELESLLQLHPWISKLKTDLEDDPTCSTILIPANVRALDTLGAVSLNHVRVVVDGVMSVATNAIPANIANVAFDGEKTNSSLWMASADSSATLEGTITGTYLTDSTPTVTNAQDLGISDVAPVSDGSSDTSLRFSLKLSKTIPDQKELTFVLKKKSAPDSTPYVYKVQYIPSTKAVITKISFEKEDADPTLWTEGGKLTGTITGEHLFGGKAQISIENSEGLGISDMAVGKTNSSDGALPFTMELSKQVPVPDGTVLKFTVAASAAGGAADQSDNAGESANQGDSAGDSAAKSDDTGGSADKPADSTSAAGKSAKKGSPNGGAAGKAAKDGGAASKPDTNSGTPGKTDNATYSYVVHYAFDIKTVHFIGETTAAVWEDTKNPLKGTITGDNLEKCTPEIAEAKTLGLEDPKPDKDSTDKALKFTMQLGKRVENGTKLTFTLSKTAKDADGKDVTLHSGTYTYSVKYTSKPAAPPKPPAPKPKQPAGVTGSDKKTTQP